MLTVIKKRVPWWSKIAAKVVLSRAPLPYRFWQAISVFRHGGMDKGLYALAAFNRHVDKAGLNGGMSGRVVLELGPGDSIATAIVAYAHGARAILIDVGAYAKPDMSTYHQICKVLVERGLSPPDIKKAKTLADVLAACQALYKTDGLASLRQVDSESVDLVFSQAVLEHVRRHEFSATMSECRRVLKPSGVCSHSVDLKDHLGGGLNNLRFSERVWESSLFANSGFYTNRIHCSEMLSMFKDAGFDIADLQVERWEELPISRSKLSKEFCAIPNEELSVMSFDVLLKPRFEFLVRDTQ